MVKKALLVILIICCASSVFAFRLVLDSSNLLQAIFSYAQAIEDFTSQIQYYKTYYNTLVRAAEDLTSGNFAGVVNAISRISGSTSRLPFVTGTAEEVLSSLENDSLNLLDVYKTTNAVGYNISAITQAITAKVERMKALTEAGFQDFSYTGSGWDDLVSYGNSIFDIASLVTGYVSNIGDLAQSGSTLLNELFTVSRPSEKYEALMKLKQDLISEYGTETDITAQIQNSTDELNKLQDELKNTSADQETKLMQLEQNIAKAQESIEQYKNLKDLYGRMNKLEQQLKNQLVVEGQGSYEAQMDKIENQVSEFVNEARTKNFVNSQTELVRALDMPVSMYY